MKIVLFTGLCVVALVSGCGVKKETEISLDQAKEAGVKEHKSGRWSPELSDEEKETLFGIATDSLDWCVNDRGGAFSFDEYTITEKLKVETATFVTLKIGEGLRGCIGSLQPVDSLYESIHKNAVFAAMQDHRFRPVSPEELRQIDVNISILSPIEDIATLDEFNIGEHGIIMSKGPNRAVYLPEVAVEQGWGKDDTLSSLSEKAGLRPDAWKDNAQFQVFSSVGLSK